MIKKFIILFFVFFLVENLFSQNLVPNYSFEDTLICPTAVNQVYNAPPWFRPTTGTSDYFNSCSSNQYINIPANQFGFQASKSGFAYAGFGVYWIQFTDYREYLEVPLYSNLIANKKYCVEFYISLGDSSEYAIKEIGAYFSQDSILSNTVSPLPFIPQIENLNIVYDTSSWILVSGQFVAQGGERFITIGNFKNDVNTSKMVLDSFCTNNCDAYYYIDDVSVYCCDNANTQINLGTDKVICRGNGITIGQPQVSGYYYRWSLANGLNINDTSIAQPIVKPTLTSTYYLFVEDTSKKQSCNNTAADSITVFVIEPTLTIANAGNAQTICSGDSAILGTAAQNGYTYHWQPFSGLSDSAIAQPLASPAQTTQYFLTVQDSGKYCPAAQDSVIVSVIILPVANAGKDTTFCEGDSAILGSTEISGYKYQWQPTTNLSAPTIAQPTASPQQTTEYFLTVQDTGNYCSPVQDSVIISVVNLPLADAGGDRNICKGENTNIGTAGINGYKYHWQPATGLSDTTAAQPAINSEQETRNNYQLTVTDTANLCPSDTDNTNISIIDCDTIKENIAFLPSIFSPNGDGANDVFRVRGENIAEGELAIYNRWGEKVFEMKFTGSDLNDISKWWDGTHNGKPLNTGVFVYYLKISFEDGKTEKLKGNVTLVR